MLPEPVEDELEPESNSSAKRILNLVLPMLHAATMVVAAVGERAHYLLGSASSRAGRQSVPGDLARVEVPARVDRAEDPVDHRHARCGDVLLQPP